MLTRCDKFHYWNRAARCGYRTRASDFISQCVLFRRRTRCSFVLFHPSVYNGTLQDQSSSHLSAILEMPDRYFTARPRFVREIFFFIRICACKSLSLSQIFTLDFLIFAEAMMRKPRVSRDDYSEWSREVPPGWCKLNRKRLLGLYIFQRGSSSVIHESSFCLGFCSDRCPLFWHISQSIGKFIRSQPL